MRITVWYARPDEDRLPPAESFEDVYDWKVQDGILTLMWYGGRRVEFPLTSLQKWEKM